MVTNITSVEQLDFLDVHKNDGDIYSVFFQIKEGKVIEPETREKVKSFAEKYIKPLSTHFNYEGSGAWNINVNSGGKVENLDPREYVIGLLEFWENIKDLGKYEEYSHNYGNFPEKFFSWEKPIRIPD